MYLIFVSVGYGKMTETKTTALEERVHYLVAKRREHTTLQSHREASWLVRW